MSTNFRTRMFGGFDREDVVAYIKKITQENQAQLEKLTQQNQDLSQENDGLRQEVAALRSRLDSYESSAREKDELSQQNQRLAQENRDLQDAMREMEERCGLLQEQADEYAKIRDHIAEIEISAHRRTEEFRAQAIQRIHTLVAQQRRWCNENRVRYEELLQRFAEKLETAKNVVQESDLSGFGEMLTALDELDKERSTKRFSFFPEAKFFRSSQNRATSRSQVMPRDILPLMWGVRSRFLVSHKR